MLLAPSLKLRLFYFSAASGSKVLSLEEETALLFAFVKRIRGVRGEEEASLSFLCGLGSLMTSFPSLSHGDVQGPARIRGGGVLSGVAGRERGPAAASPPLAFPARP